MARATKAEIKEAREEQAYWQELHKWLPWRVSGWTGKRSAWYRLEGMWPGLELTGHQRDELVAAFERAAKLPRPRPIR